MSDEEKLPDNYDRLLNHLNADSLAARLVQAYRAPEAGGPMEAMKAVLRERIEKEREEIDATET
jgi:hypothetical protein